MAYTLLILTDLFPDAPPALAYVANLARPLGARLVLLHVRPAAATAEEPDAPLTNPAAEALDVAASGGAGQPPVPVVAEVGYGPLAEAVAAAVGRHHPLLMAIGRPSLPPNSAPLVPAPTLALLQAVPCALLVVPNPVPAPGPPHRVLLAVDGGGFSVASCVGEVRNLLAGLGAELTVLHIVPDTGPVESPPLVLNSVRHAGLEVALPPVRTHTIIHAHAGEGILQVAQPADYDLLVLIARQHCVQGSLFQHSVMAQLLRACPLPLLVLPAD